MITITFYAPEVDNEDLKIEDDYVSAQAKPLKVDGDEEHEDNDDKPYATYSSLCNALYDGKKEENFPSGECNIKPKADDVVAFDCGERQIKINGQIKKGGRCVEGMYK